MHKPENHTHNGLGHRLPVSSTPHEARQQSYVASQPAAASTLQFALQTKDDKVTESTPPHRS